MSLNHVLNYSLIATDLYHAKVVNTTKWYSRLSQAPGVFGNIRANLARLAFASDIAYIDFSSFQRKNVIVPLI